MPDVGIDQRLNEQVPLDLVFRDERAESLTLGKILGERPVILVLAYYCCPRICSLALNNLSESLRRIDYDPGKQFAIVVVSIDPRETPEQAAAKKATCLEAYARPGTDAGWHFLTGTEPAIQKLAAAVGFRYAYVPEQDQYAHAAGIMMLTPEGKIARYFYGLDYAPRDLRFGLEDAAAGKAGLPTAAPLRLLCFAYNPATGKYTLLSLRLVQGAGLLTVVLVGVFLVRNWRLSRIVAPSAPSPPVLRGRGLG